MTSRPHAEISPESAPYWRALQEGKLSFQRCRTCGNAWLPSRSECPRCLADLWEWEPSSGSGSLISWVVYHTAYHPYFEDKLPYTVGIVELDEGPRMIAGIVDPPSVLRIDQKVILRAETDDGQALAMFAVASESR